MGNLRLNPRVGAVLSLLVFLLTMVGLATAGFMASSSLSREVAARAQRLGVLQARITEVTAKVRDGHQDSFAAQLGTVWPASTPGVAGARLQSSVMSLIRRAGGSVQTVQVLPAGEADRQRIAIAFSFQADISALRDILYQIESGQPLVFVDQLSITAPTASPRQRVARRPNAMDRQLAITLQLSSYLATETAG